MPVGASNARGRGPDSLPLMFFLFSPAASAHAREVDFSPQVGANVQGSLELREMGAVRLGRYLGTRPVVLVLVYFGCRNLCPLLLDGVSEALARSGLKPDVDYAALFVSIDPRDEEAPPRRRAGISLQNRANSRIPRDSSS